MAINWGTRILLLYVGFVLLIGTLVWKSTHININLVAEDYYAQELVFQKKLDAGSATAGLTNKPVISLTPEAIMIFFPQEFSGKSIQADLQLYSPANSSFDRTFTKLRTEDGKLKINRNDLPAATYTGKLTWNCEGKTYYQEAPLNLNWK